ncbi:HAMP domain-containing sensor histidine kinase [Candidatus Clostridium radicumherbarum]|uniref:histidine kinase n=1 Tax=Candidatus Clostridium radicumherbarum TaxID=3381662 RepID=A0ABW8TQR6_9CLOT
MNIKRRTLLSNSVIVTIPIVVTFIAALILSIIVPGVFHKNAGFENFKELLAVKAELLDNKSGILIQNPETIKDANFQNYMKAKLLSFNGEIAIINNDKLLYSSKNFNKIDIEKFVEDKNNPSINNSIKVENILYTIETLPVKLNDGTTADIILLAPIGEQQSLQDIILILIIIFVISFIAVNTFASYLFSKRILKPVELLKRAAGEISSGNLDYEVVEAGDQEIMELCRDFEKMRIQLKDSVQEKTKYDDNRNMLVSSISHDLKTPITSIKGYVEGILDGVANTQDKLDSYLRTVYSKAELIDSLIDDLLLYSKLDLKKLPFDFEKTDAEEYFKYCIFDSAIELEKVNIKINLKNDLEGVRFITIDRERMRRVIMNIIDNSRKYMDKEEGQITITLRETNLSIVIEIRDNGSGIEKEDANKIFDRFYRGDSARTETKGTGLGLAIAKQIVEGHKGRIWAISHGSAGTSILISLAKQER